jgi:hypothetical protein
MDMDRIQITLDQVKPPRPVIRMARRQLEKWSQQHNNLPQSGAIEITHENDHYIACSLQLVTEQDSWVAHEVGKTYEEALGKCLKAAHPAQ